jgi:hypothetical protein
MEKEVAPDGAVNATDAELVIQVSGSSTQLIRKRLILLSRIVPEMP